MLRFLRAILVLAFVCLLCPVAQAALTFNLGLEFSGAQSPTEAPPWLRATFTSTGANTVTLVMENLLDVGFVAGGTGEKGWYFNVDPLPSLTFVKTGGVDAVVYQGLNSFKADGDGKYDVAFSFKNAGLVAGATSSWTITGTGLTESSFNALSAPAGGHGPFRTAAHVQGLTGGGSGWVTEGGIVPAPAAAGLVFIGLGLIGWFRRRFA